MKMKTTRRSLEIVILAALVAILALTGTASAQDGRSLEALYGYLVSPNEVTFQVQSQGCTDKDSFWVENQSGVVMLFRVEDDTCSSDLAYGARVTFTVEELGYPPFHQDIRIGNPLLTHADIDPALAALATGDPLDIATTLSASDNTPVLVHGLLFVGSGVIDLCTAQNETAPPSCGGPSIPVDGLNLSVVPILFSDAGVSWSTDIVLGGTVSEGRLTMAYVVQ